MGSAEMNFAVLESYITLIKTGPIAPGPQTFNGAELFSGRFSGIPGKSFSAGLSGTVVQAHCGSNTVSADPVQLGEWDQQDFTGTGYTTAAIPFNITLSNCEADGSNINIATANIRFEDASAIPFVTSFPGVFGLTPDSTARGIGIQILKGDGSTPMELNTEVPLKPISASGTVLDFTARFYQTEPSLDVHPGIAKGALNFTLTYK
ncbi:Type-1 fimbrial protein, A chain precursor [compost metagenome]